MPSSKEEAQQSKPPISARTISNRNGGASYSSLHSFNRLTSDRHIQSTDSMIPSPHDSSTGADISTSAHANINSSSFHRNSEYSSLLQTQGNAMRVYVRVRPYSKREIAQKNMSHHSTVRIDLDNPCMITLFDPSRDFRPVTTYSFTRCFWSVFEHSTDGGTRTNLDVSDLCETVGTYLNGAPGVPRRLHRSGSLSGREKLASPCSSRGGGLQERTFNEINKLVYGSSGSNAVIVDSNVGHPPYASQAEVYRYVGRPILENALDGYNGCIFAYGQTGSGKTFTMLGYTSDAHCQAKIRDQSNRSTDVSNMSGRSRMELSTGCDSVGSGSQSNSNKPPLKFVEARSVVNKSGIDPSELRGIIPRICADLFETLRLTREKDPSCSYRVEVSYFEIYQDKFYDLIRPQKSTDLKIRHNPTSGPYVDGLCYKLVTNQEDVAAAVQKGIQERHTAATKFNDHSSRGHAILSLNIVQLFLDGGGTPSKTQGKLNLVDLAGSERAGQAGVDRPEYDEGVKINQSLTVLGRVIDCLADLSQNKSLAVPVPYRDSKLTLVLMDSIGGNSQTSMVATISPHTMNYEEMKQTLRYASRAKQIVNRAVRNEDPQVVLIRELRSEVERLQRMLREVGGCGYTREYVLDLEQQVTRLTKKNSDQELMLATMRAELERKGLVDPTCAESCAVQTPSSTKSLAAERTGEMISQKFVPTKKGAAIRRASTEQEDKVSDVYLTTCGKQIVKQEREIAHYRAADAMHRDTIYALLEATMLNLNMVLNYTKKKEAIVLNTFWNVLLRAYSEVREIVKHMKSAHEYEMNACKGNFEGQLEIQAQRFQRKLRETVEESAHQQRQLVDKHKKTLTQMEEHMQRNRAIYEESRKRMEDEKEELRKQSSAQLAKERELYQQEIKRLRASFGDTVQDSQRSTKELQQAREAQARELDRLREEIEHLKRTKEVDLSRVKYQLENEQSRRQSELIDKDRQRHKLELEMADLRRQFTTLELEKAKKQLEYEEHLALVLQRQDDIINTSSSVLKDWESKSTSMEADLCRLRELVHDQDYMNLRQRMRDSAFRQRMNYDQALQDVEEKQRRDTQKFLEILTKAKKVQEEHDESLQRYQEEMQQWLHLKSSDKEL
ncbi:unnamed protein product [Phytomonas sp. EM1]|nr:unnamed protein product [Phytomonas sp. EM1]|eukprot:CCW60786.1 unnamed protein product [Phytomonas sp. isolate EM1]